MKFKFEPNKARAKQLIFTEGEFKSYFSRWLTEQQIKVLNSGARLSEIKEVKK